MAKISPKKESDKPRNPVVVAVEKLQKRIDDAIAPVTDAIANLHPYARELDKGPRPEIDLVNGPIQVMSVDELHRAIGKHDAEENQSKQSAKAAHTDGGEDVPQTFAELFDKPDEDIPRLTSIFQDHKLVSGDGKWINGDKSRKRTLMLSATDVLKKYPGFKSHLGDKVIAPLISRHYCVTLSKRSQGNRADDRTGLKEAIREAFFSN